MRALLSPLLLFAWLTGLLTFINVGVTWAGEWRGNIAGEFRYFPQDALDPRQFEGSNLSFSAQPEYYNSWDNDSQSFIFTPYVRVDRPFSSFSPSRLVKGNFLVRNDKCGNSIHQG